MIVKYSNLHITFILSNDKLSKLRYLSSVRETEPLYSISNIYTFPEGIKFTLHIYILQKHRTSTFFST